LKKEKWKKIRNSKKYEISNEGSVRNCFTDCVLKPSVDKYGYPRISFKDDFKKTQYKTIHRLVAETWIPNNDKTLQVNHKDGIKKHNSKNNLEWVTIKRNINHSYENLLNKNTNPVKLTNLINKEDKYFKSIKELGKFLNIYPSVLVPLIKYSDKNPVLGKYKIIITDEKAMMETANTINCGRTIYVYDLIEEKLSSYPSVVIASYYTGLRSLSNIDNKNTYIFTAGYYASFNKEEIPLLTNIDKDEILDSRIKYWNKPYVPVAEIKYYTYDYYTNIENVFDNVDEIVKYLNTLEPANMIISNRRFSTSLGTGVKTNRSALLKGVGIKSNLYDYEWFPYKEYVILSNRCNLPAPTMFYKVKLNNEEKIILGIKNLCDFLKYRSDKPYFKITLDEILKTCNIPNLSVTCLNKPIKNELR
jgi:hypothetical protein